MAASVLTLYCNNPIQSNSSAGLLTLTQPGASTSTTGWTVGKLALDQQSRMSYNIETPTTSFSVGDKPDGAPQTANGHWAEDCWRISAATTGQFSAGTWYSSLSMIAVTSGGVQDGQARFRIWRSSSESGAGATELTPVTVVGGLVTNLSTTVAQSSAGSVQIAASNLTGEYLFLQCAWRISGAGGVNSNDVLIRLGSMQATSGSGLVTSAFSSITPAGGDPTDGGYYQRRRSLDAMCAMDEV